VKFLATLALLICALTGCNRASQSKEAIRQSVIDYVSSKVNVGSMDVDVTSIDFKGAEADATVAFRPKGGDPASGLQMRYTLEQKSGKWVVKDKSQAGGAPHGAGAPMGGNPHGAANPQEGSGTGQLPPGHPPLAAGEGKR
jgi:hypothetical protein